MIYSEMSDFEINKEVAIKHLGYYEEGSRFVNTGTDSSKHYSGKYPLRRITKNSRYWKPFEPCNSWADIGPIIEKYGIEISIMLSGDWCASRISKYTYDSAPIYSNDEQFSDENPKLAAAIVFLMIEVE